MKIKLPPNTVIKRPLAMGILTCLALLLSSSAFASLDKNVGTPPSYNWESAKTTAKDPLLNPVFDVLKKYNVPAATIGYQLNPDPNIVPYVAPTKWRNPQAWWMAGFGINYRAPLRLASVSKPILAMIYYNTPVLRGNIDQPFYKLWNANVSALPTPKDPRVKDITIRHLLNHVSGFYNSTIGFDPAFTGKNIDVLLPDIIKTKNLLTAPGSQPPPAEPYTDANKNGKWDAGEPFTDTNKNLKWDNRPQNYSNFGYMILGRLAEGLTKTPFGDLVRSGGGFVQPIPGFSQIGVASDATAASAKMTGAAEPSIYYVQSPDVPFNVNTMIGNGGLISNVATLSWLGTRYWIAGSSMGRSFDEVPPKGAPMTFNGSMPGTQAALVQYFTPKGHVASMCILLNTRKGDLLPELNKAMVDCLKNKFSGF